jgi:hypothetical protein
LMKRDASSADEEAEVENTSQIAAAPKTEYDSGLTNRMKAAQDRIDSMKAELQTLRAAPPVAAPAQADPVLNAQLDALTAKAQQIADRIEAINQRAASMEKQVKTN